MRTACLGVAAGLCRLRGARAREIEAPQRGCVVMLPGVESGAWQFTLTTDALKKAGVRARIEIIEWGDKLPPISSITNLMDYRRNLQRAREIAALDGNAQRPGR